MIYYSSLISDNFSKHLSQTNLPLYSDNFLELTSEISECMICCNKTQEFITCEKCSYSFCQKCGKEMIEFDKIIELKNNFKYKCPQCRQYNENLNINIRWLNYKYY